MPLPMSAAGPCDKIRGILQPATDFLQGLDVWHEDRQVFS